MQSLANDLPVAVDSKQSAYRTDPDGPAPVLQHCLNVVADGAVWWRPEVDERELASLRIPFQPIQAIDGSDPQAARTVLQ
jgi:hypothetical protein